MNAASTSNDHRTPDRIVEDTIAAERRLIDGIVEEARTKLVAVYPEVADPRFPYAMHHSVARNKIREPVTRRNPRHSDIAALLSEWAKLHGGPQVYAWQSVLLATQGLRLVKPSAEADAVIAEANSALQKAKAPGFITWAKANIASKQPSTKRTAA